VKVLLPALVQVEVQRIWERDSRTVAVRWKLRCFPRLLDRSLVNLDGISEYRFNDKGLIYEHKVLPPLAPAVRLPHASMRLGTCILLW
jgi:hypothetical protein